MKKSKGRPKKSVKMSDRIRISKQMKIYIRKNKKSKESFGEALERLMKAKRRKRKIVKR